MSNTNATRDSLPNRYQGVASVWGASDSSGRNTKVMARGEVVIPPLPTVAPTPTPTATPPPTPTPTATPVPTATPTPTPTPTISPTPTPTAHGPFSNWSSTGIHGSNIYGGDLSWAAELFFQDFDVPNNRANYLVQVTGGGCDGFRVRAGATVYNHGDIASLDCGVVYEMAAQAHYLFWADIIQSVSNYTAPFQDSPYVPDPTPTPTPSPTPTPTP
jgi:hypothetical protein